MVIRRTYPKINGDQHKSPPAKQQNTTKKKKKSVLAKDAYFETTRERNRKMMFLSKIYELIKYKIFVFSL